MSEETRVYWIAGAAGATVLAILWLTGAVAGALFGSGWAPITLDQLLFAAIRLTSHLDSPRAAWPHGVGHNLPGAIGFYSTLAAVSAALASIAYFARQVLDRLGIGLPLTGGAKQAPSARMATRRDLQLLRVPSPQPGRLTLGRRGGMLLAAEERQSVIVFAPTQTFKTTGFVIPSALEWNGPMLITSIKTDVLSATLARRQAMGEVHVFDPAHVTEMPRSRATPLWGATSWRGATRVAHWLVGASNIVGAGGIQDAQFWASMAEKLLAPLLFAAATNDRTVSQVVRWLDEGPEASEAEVTGLLEDSGVGDALRAWRATLNREERQRSSVYTTAEVAVQAFSDPYVIEETAGSDYTPTTLLDGGANTLYLCAPEHEQERLAPLFSMLVQELLAVVAESTAATGKPLDPPLLLLLDEAATIAPIPNLDKVAATVAGQGIQLLTIVQDFSQLSAIYGRRAPTAVNNHAAKIVGSGIADPETTTYFSRIVGTARFEQFSQTAGEKGRRSKTEGETHRDLLPASAQRETEPGSGLLVYRHLPPTNFSLRVWFEERKLRELQHVSRSNRRVRRQSRGPRP
ncbi:MAG TPA: type IV secretory system conjugative DNA transfer family protein [Solirubrobacterales bacterium]|nr:type IV secretory system conjugative DNA transfer family protein [Solirubrobacterales bacterium]